MSQSLQEKAKPPQGQVDKSIQESSRKRTHNGTYMYMYNIISLLACIHMYMYVYMYMYVHMYMYVCMYCHIVYGCSAWLSASFVYQFFHSVALFLVQDSTFEFERRRNVPVRYNRQLWQQTGRRSTAQLREREREVYY